MTEESSWNPPEWVMADESPYQRWQKGEGIPIHEGSFVPDLYTVELAHWPRLGQRGAFINLANQEIDDTYVLEIAPGGQTEVQHHFFETMIYILNGRGATTIWQEPGGRKQTVEWQRGTVFSPPMNCYYQHFNLDGQRPTRMIAATSAPKMMDIIRDTACIFDNPFVFRDRYNLQDDYFTNPGRFVGWHNWITNYVADVRSYQLMEWPEHGAGSIVQFQLSSNTMVCHITEWPTGTYPKAHRHGPGAHVVIIEGQGYSLLWWEGREKERVRVDWKDGTILSPRENEFHQHFNTGPTNVRQLAFRLGGLERQARVANPRTRERIDGIPYESQDPDVYDLWAQECAKNGAEVQLPRPNFPAR